MITRLQNLYSTFTTVVNRFTNKDDDGTKKNTHNTQYIMYKKIFTNIITHTGTNEIQMVLTGFGKGA